MEKGMVIQKPQRPRKTLEVRGRSRQDLQPPHQLKHGESKKTQQVAKHQREGGIPNSTASGNIGVGEKVKAGGKETR